MSPTPATVYWNAPLATEPLANSATYGIRGLCVQEMDPEGLLPDGFFFGELASLSSSTSL